MARSVLTQGLVDTRLVMMTATGRTCYEGGSGLLLDGAYWREVLDGAPVALLVSRELLGRFEAVVEALGDPLTVPVPDGEDAKCLSAVAEVYERLAQAQFPRSGVVVALGGGSVTDLAGLIAATWKRGTRLVHVPTTLTGQVDAAIGGKSAVNLPEGKNLVGVIYQPERVVADRDALATVPTRDFRGGVAEIIKCGFIADPIILDLLDGWCVRQRRDDDCLRELIRRSVEVKMSLVKVDELDLGVRRHLNYGHTLGQALESAMAYRGLNHGEAVGLGMLFAAAVAEAQGTIRGLVRETRRHLAQVGLPTSLRYEVGFDAVWALVGQDKKAGTVGREFVLCDRPGSVRLTSLPDRATARDAFAQLQSAGGG